MSGLLTGFRVAPQSILKIRQAALNTRLFLALPDGRIDVPRLLEQLHKYGITYDIFDHASAPVGQGIEACWVPENATLYIKDTVYDDACNGGTRATFTVSHEMGHVVLAHRRTINREAPGPIRSYENSEWQANTFASEFAMPLPTIEKLQLTTPAQIAGYFGVSMKAAEIRIEKLTGKK